ncbi:hypothetical protein [Methanothermobacter sp. K4]|uniref:hypothetical protein n=1 Tax=Methanothermobacter sp. K4 TaxID=2913262 RepID=UPI001EDC0956|nr:hypothetical protein [Methanothermobacter sp. K4]
MAHAVILGNRSYGYVEKTFYGNSSSSDTITVIIGVHPRESGVHEAVKYHIRRKNFRKRFVLYHVHVTRNAMSFSRGRMNGQLLARDFIVPDIKNEKPMLVIDCHQNAYRMVGYRYSRFLDPISKKNSTRRYVNQIRRRMPFLKIYHPPVSSSPRYLTVPVASQGYSTVIYETNGFDSAKRKLIDAEKLLVALDRLER